MNSEAAVQVAQSVADVADSVSMFYFGRSRLATWNKDDGSLVTEADLAVERNVRSKLAELGESGAGVLGEERGGSDVETRWIVDPIDGTENFSRGHPVWGTLLAKEERGVLIAGVISAPALGFRWSAGRGLGAFYQTAGVVERCRVSGLRNRRDATIGYGGLHECPSARHRSTLMAAASTFRCAWGWGNFWPHVLVAQGVIEAGLSYGVHIWDVAAPVLVVAEAGGEWSDLSGARSLRSGTLVTTNSYGHGELLRDLDPDRVPSVASGGPG